MITRQGIRLQQFWKYMWSRMAASLAHGLRGLDPLPALSGLIPDAEISALGVQDNRHAQS